MQFLQVCRPKSALRMCLEKFMEVLEIKGDPRSKDGRNRIRKGRVNADLVSLRQVLEFALDQEGQDGEDQGTEIALEEALDVIDRKG